MNLTLYGIIREHALLGQEVLHAGTNESYAESVFEEARRSACQKGRTVRLVRMKVAKVVAEVVEGKAESNHEAK